METEERACAHCGACFQVDPRGGERHRACARAECQRERRRVAQQQRRKERGVPSITSESGKKRRAAYMRSYREAEDGYRTREREAAARRRRRGTGALGVVTEAESGEELARVYVVPGPGSAIRLHVVTEAGLSVMVSVVEASEPAPVAS